MMRFFVLDAMRSNKLLNSLHTAILVHLLDHLRSKTENLIVCI